MNTCEFHSCTARCLWRCQQELSSSHGSPRFGEEKSKLRPPCFSYLEQSSCSCWVALLDRQMLRLRLTCMCTTPIGWLGTSTIRFSEDLSSHSLRRSITGSPKRLAGA